MKDQSLVDQWLFRLKNKPIVAFILILFLIVSAIVSFSNNVFKLKEQLDKNVLQASDSIAHTKANSTKPSIKQSADTILKPQTIIPEKTKHKEKYFLLKGIVKNQENEYLEGVKILLSCTEEVFYTNANGQFDIKLKPEKTIQKEAISVSFLKTTYQSWTQDYFKSKLNEKILLNRN